MGDPTPATEAEARAALDAAIRRFQEVSARQNQAYTRLLRLFRDAGRAVVAVGRADGTLVTMFDDLDLPRRYAARRAAELEATQAACAEVGAEADAALEALVAADAALTRAKRAARGDAPPAPAAGGAPVT